MLCETKPRETSNRITSSGWRPDGVYVDLDDMFCESVGFLAHKRKHAKAAPEGTVFFLRYQADTGDYMYAVTAQHCIDAATEKTEIWFSARDGSKHKTTAPRSSWTNRKSVV